MSVKVVMVMKFGQYYKYSVVQISSPLKPKHIGKGGEKDMILECREYTQSELLKTLGITEWQWKRRRAEVDSNLSDCCDYEIKTKGRSNIYIIKEIYQEFIPLQRKNVIISEAKLKDYSLFALGQIKIMPLNSVANIARIAANDEELDKKYCLVPHSIEKYVRPFIKSSKIKSTGKKWVYLKDNIYIELNEEQEEYLKTLFETMMGKKGLMSLIDILADFKAKNITAEEVGQQIIDENMGTYDMVITTFKVKYGFTPFKAHYFEINVLELTEEEKEYIKKALEQEQSDCNDAIT